MRAVADHDDAGHGKKRNQSKADQGLSSDRDITVPAECWRQIHTPVRGESEPRRNRGGTAVRDRSGKLRQGGLSGRGVGLTSSHQTGRMPLGSSWRPHVPPPLRLINSVGQTRSTRPSHGKVLASLSYEPLGVCSLVRRQTPVGHGVFMPCHKRVAPARTSTTRVRQMVEHSGDP